MACKDVKVNISVESPGDEIFFKIQYGMVWEMGMCKYRQVMADLSLSADDRKEKMNQVYSDTVTALKNVCDQYGRSYESI